MRPVRALLARLGKRRGDEAAGAEAPPAFDPSEPAFLADPYPTYAALRERSPIHRSAGGAWVLSRYEDIVAALDDPRLGNAPSTMAVVHPRNRERYTCADVAARILPFLDPPEHAAPRKLVGRAFHQHLATEPPDLDGIAREVLAPLRGRDRFDLVADFGTPFSARVLCEVLGFPPADGERLARWSTWFFYLLTGIPDEEARAGLDRALAEWRSYIAEIVARRRERPQGDLISRLLATDEGLDPQGLVDTCMLLFADGVENVDSAIANAVLALDRHPEQLAALRADRSLLPAAVDECLRYDSPAQFIARVAREPLTLGTSEIAPRSAVLLLLGSANRDPARFADPDRLDLGRRPNPHLSFGRGRHSCIGGPLVRDEMAAALGALLDLPDLRVVENDLRWKPRVAHRWPQRLEVTHG